MTEQIDKEIVKEALKEWLDDQFTKFGKWSFGAVCSAVLFLVVYAAIQNGWRPF